MKLKIKHNYSDTVYLGKEHKYEFEIKEVRNRGHYVLIKDVSQDLYNIYNTWNSLLRDITFEDVTAARIFCEEFAEFYRKDRMPHHFGVSEECSDKEKKCSKCDEFLQHKGLLKSQ